ncbi:MAG TPA: efflux RND transporter periplasmic adaptor subunit [Pirellulaceae bacterium]|nr:efflux RND transporter periplasmic adaptor subunit [Pirellulaceae bacterium]
MYRLFSKTIKTIRWLVVPLIVLAAIGWFRFSPLSAQSFTPHRQTIVEEVLGTGTLEARVSATISPKIAGRIAQVLVDQGQEVRAGQVLVRLDDQELKQQVAIAEASLEAAQAATQRLIEDKRRTVAVFEQARRHHERLKALVDQRATSLDEFERAAESLAIASADMARAEAAIAEGQKNVVAAEKNFDYHKTRLADTEVLAPFDGLITVRQRESGDIAVPGSPVLTLISQDEMWISAWVDETAMSRVADGQPARVVFRSEPDRDYQGVVSRLGRQADRESREFIVDVRVSPLPQNWAVGQRAEVYIETNRRDNALAIPASSILLRDGRAGVFVDRGGVATWQLIQSGARGAGFVEVLDGISDSDTVIVPPQGVTEDRLDGHRVRTQPAASVGPAG